MADPQAAADRSIELRPITRDSFYNVVRLTVHDEQRMFVAPNAFSIAEAQFYDTWEPLSIYHEDELVGFVMWGTDDRETPPDFWIIRLMIDKDHQGNGYGKAAMQSVMAHILQNHSPAALYVSFEPHNEVARTLYSSLDFTDTGA